MSRPALILVLALVAGFIPADASAQARWDPEWREFGVADAVITAGFAVLAITTEIVGAPRQPRWERPILADQPLRSALGGTTTRGERRAALASDVGVILMMTAPVLDAAAVGYGVHRDVKLATNLGLFSLESLAISSGVTNLTKVVVGRARPLTAECLSLKLSSQGRACERRPNVSFFSGHTTAAFTGAGLICAFGTVTPMHGEGVVGQIPCVSALAVAAATATLRIVANKHHLSDVITGVVVGLLSGWALPALRLGGG